MNQRIKTTLRQAGFVDQIERLDRGECALCGRFAPDRDADTGICPGCESSIWAPEAPELAQ